MELIKEAMLDHVELFLQENNEFYPFGILLDNKFASRSIMVVDKSIEETIFEIRKEIQRLGTEVCEYHSGGYCIDTFASGVNKIQMNLISKTSNGWIQFYLPYFTSEEGVDYGAFEDA